MIAKIGKGSNMYGAILYNQQKVDKEKRNSFIAEQDTRHGGRQVFRSVF